MTDNDKQKTLLTRYLLGQVSTEERAELEDRYLHDDDLFEELAAAENDMIDAYVRGRLAPSEKQQFETYFLCAPERRERVKFAEALVNTVTTAPRAEELRRGAPTYSGGTQFTAVRVALVAALAATAIGLFWMAILNWRLHRQLEEARAEHANAQQQAQKLQQQIEALQNAHTGQDQMEEAASPGSAIVSLTLATDLPRNWGQPNTLYLSPGISRVRLLIKQNLDQHLPYTAVLETAEGRRVWQKPGLEARPVRGGGQVVTAEVPPAVLRRGDYVLRLLRTAA